MSIRKDPIYISTEVGRALWLLSKMETSIATDRPIMTPDEIADRELREVIKSKWPQLFEFQKETEKREKTLIESLRNG